MSLQLTLDTWLTNNQSANQTEQFKDLVKALDYDGLTDFFNDNSGCIEACYSWIGIQKYTKWKDLLAIPLRSDIQDLLDNGFIELDYDNRYIAVSTNQVILIENNDGARFLVGSIEVNGDNAIFFDEADNKIKGIEHQEAYGVKFE
jgi:hypothetical protein